jgi:hypothetical protein
MCWIENREHGLRDVDLAEDASTSHAESAPHAFATFRGGAWAAVTQRLVHATVPETRATET